MQVFNLTNQPVDYRGKLIAPYGSAEFDIRFIPERDLKLESAGILSFGTLPRGWSKPQPKPEAVPVQPRPKYTESVLELPAVAEAVEAPKEEKYEKKKRF